MPTPADKHAELFAQALGYPDAYEEEPWGHPAIKVRKKAFMFCSSLGADSPTLSVKLPASAAEARQHDEVSPTGYGLGRHGWCSVQISEAIPLELLLDWVDESYRAVAPKSLVKQLGSGRPPPRAMTAAAEPDPDADEVPRVLLVGAGPQRLERARLALADLGIAAACVDLEEALDAAGGLQPEAVVVDLGRQAVAATPRLAELGLICPDADVWAVGVKPAARSALAGSLPERRISAQPPGDPAVVGSLAEQLRQAR